ncbi:MAG: ATP-binding cassette domain-containing protein [Rhodobacterales bacterium]|nr:ATP-binding cassette domain-containing protein [Rhodobacterales bacterium]
MTGLSIEALTIRRGPAPPLVSLSVTIPPGRVLTVMGPSGSGKSTLLAAILGVLPEGFAMTGRVRLDGADLTALPPHRRGIGILFQDDLLFPHLSVGDNLAFALPPALRGAARRAAVETALVEAELPGLADRDPATLSGGQRARVALMRVLLARPRAVLLDEPFSRLDAGLRLRFRAQVLGRLAAAGLPAILVTHDPADAAAAGGPIVDPQGRPLG